MSRKKNSTAAIWQTSPRLETRQVIAEREYELARLRLWRGLGRQKGAPNVATVADALNISVHTIYNTGNAGHSAKAPEFIRAINVEYTRQLERFIESRKENAVEVDLLTLKSEMQ